MTVVVSPQARDDIGEAYRHLSVDNLEAAGQFLARIAEVIGLLAAGGVKADSFSSETAGPFRAGRSHPIGSPIASLRRRSRFSVSTIRPAGRSRDDGS